MCSRGRVPRGRATKWQCAGREGIAATDDALSHLCTAVVASDAMQCYYADRQLCSEAVQGTRACIWRDDDATDGQRALIYTLYSGMQFHMMDLPLSPLAM